MAEGTKNLYKKVLIKEKNRDTVLCVILGKQNEEEIINKRLFLYFEDVEVGETWTLKYNKERDIYDYYSNLFEAKYYDERFEDNKIYKGEIIKKIGKNFIVKVDKDKYVKIFETECTGNIGDEVEFILEKNIKKNKYNANCKKVLLKKFCDSLIAENVNRKKLVIKNITEAKKDEKSIGYVYDVYFPEQDTEFQIFIKKDLWNISNFCLERNYEIKLINILSNKEVTGYFSLDVKKYMKSKAMIFNLNPEADFRDEIKNASEKGEYFTAKLKCNELDAADLNFYIEREDIGMCRIDVNNFSLVELTLLETLHNEVVVVHLENKRYIKISDFAQQEAEYLKNNIEIENAQIVKVIKTFSGKLIYQLKADIKSKDFQVNQIIRNRIFFIEEEEISYSTEVIEVGRIFEKLSLKYSLKDMFFFYTRLPYLENPLVNLLKDKKIGDSVIGRVVGLEKGYINILINDKYKYTILKRDLKYLSDFEIDDFYEEGKLYEFYIEELNEDNVLLCGYNMSRLIEEFERVNIGDIIECKVRKNINNLTGFYEIKGEFIEIEIPSNEISYLNGNIDFKEDKKYQFYVLDKLSSERKLILSRKKLSKNMKMELEYSYPIGSKIEGVYFSQDKDGFYFNLVDSKGKNNLEDLTGYLPFDEIALYPDLQEFKEEILKKVYSTYKIKSYSRDFNSIYLKDKSVLLEAEDPILKISDVVKSIDFDNLYIDLNNVCKIPLLSKNEEKFYFEKRIKNEKIVFAIDKNEILFEKLEKENYLEKIEEFYKNILNKEEAIYREILTLFKEDFSKIKVAFEKVNLKNNTIEVSFKKKIKEVLKGFQEYFLQSLQDKILLGDSILNIYVEFNNLENFSEGSYKCKINDFINDNCILTIDFNDEKFIGEEFALVIEDKIKENIYAGNFYGKKAEIESNYDLYKGEKVLCSLKEIQEDKVIMSINVYEGEKEILKNCSSYIEKYLINNINTIELEEMQHIITNGETKYQNIGILKKYKGEIFTGRKIKNYIFDKKEFSSGAFGKIYKGYDFLTGKEVILKKYSANKNMPEYRSFYNEAKLLDELNLKNVMKVYWYNTDEYIGEYIKGKTFREYLKEEHSLKEKIEILINICNAVDSLHLNGVIHLDLKPENIMVENNKNIKLIDFGCSQSKYEEYGKYGTLICSSPNQCLCYEEGVNAKFNEKDDIYSLGIIMYETFTGKPPYDNNLCEEGIIKGHLSGRMVDEDVEYRYIVPTELNSEIPYSLENIINKCLEPKEKDRYEEVFDIIEKLEELI